MSRVAGREIANAVGQFEASSGTYLPCEKVDAEAGSVITVSAGTVLDIAITGQHFIVQADGSLRELSADEMDDELPRELQGIEIRAHEES